MYLREAPENKALKVKLLVNKSQIGETVQKLLDDPDTLGITSITPGLEIHQAWSVVVEYAVLSLKEYQQAIFDRLYQVSGENPTLHKVP